MKIGLASAGFMVAGDAVNYLLGRHPILLAEPIKLVNLTLLRPQPLLNQLAQCPLRINIHSKKTLHYLRSVPVQNTEQNIENMVVQFAQDTYSGLEGKDQLIRSTPGFQAVVHQISVSTDTIRIVHRLLFHPFFALRSNWWTTLLTMWPKAMRKSGISSHNDTIYQMGQT